MTGVSLPIVCDVLFCMALHFLHTFLFLPLLHVTMWLSLSRGKWEERLIAIYIPIGIISSHCYFCRLFHSKVKNIW